MGDRLARGQSGQHPDLTAAAIRAPAAAVLALLAVDGVISAILGALFLQIRLWGVPFPISALLSGLLNAALIWSGLVWTSSPRVAATALWAWLITLTAMTLLGPGGDVLFGGPGFDEYSVAVLLVLGAAPPGVLLWRHAKAARRGLR